MRISDWSSDVCSSDLLVVSATPKGVVFIDETTEVELLSEYQEPQETRRTDVTYDDLGGLGDTIDQLREMVELPLRYPELFRRLGVDRSEEHTSELQSLMRISYAVFCFQQKKENSKNN